MRQAFALIVTLTCAGCVGGARPEPVSQNESLSMEYNLPITTARVSMDLVLVSCSADGPRARPTVTVQPIANANRAEHERFRLYSTALSSWTRNRQVGLDTHPNGALRSVNGGVSDRTGAIVTNVLKTALGALPFFDAQNTTRASACNDITMQALRQVAALETRIAALRAGLPTATAADAATIREAIDGLAAEAARLRTDQLLITLTKEIEINANNSAGVQNDIAWTYGELARWLAPGDPAEREVSNFRLFYCLQPASNEASGTCPANPALPAARTGEGERADCLPDCRTTIVLREPVNATMVVIANTDEFVRLVPGHQPVSIPRRTRLQRTMVPVAQWGRLSYIPLRAGFGESFTFALGLDEFGRRNSFTWKSDARGEGITGGVASIVGAGASLDAGIRGRDLAEQQAEITQLQTQQNLNRLRFCREVIEAGGFTCPTS